MKNVVITGASGNLGKATVEKFSREGYRVIAIVSPGKTLGFEAHGVETIEGNLESEDSAASAVGEVILKYKTIDAAMFLVGGFSAGNIFDTTGDELKKMYSLNFETAYYTARPVFIQMSKQLQGGRIVFIGARPALRAKDGKGLIAYGLAKSLIFKLSEYLNAEGADKNISTAVVVPSTIDTPQNRKAMPGANFTSWVTPDAIAEVLLFFASGKADSLRESVFKVYGNA